MKLTPKQEKFAQVYVQTGNASEAYRQAYDASKMKAETITVAASKLLANYNVTTRVQQIRESVEKMQLWSKEDSIKILAGIAKGDDPEARPTDKVNAVKALNSMHGWDKQVVDHTSSDGSMSPAKSYTPEEYAQAQAKLSKELSDLD